MEHEAQMILDRGDFTMCSINVIGGTVTSWLIHHEEQLFVSRGSYFTRLAKIRGGINLQFPHFGRWNMGPPYGFTRDMVWSMEEGPKKLKNGDIWALISLKADQYTNSLYGYKFRLSYKITLCEYKLMFNIYVENLCPNFPMEFQILQHASFKIPDVRKSCIIGFHRCQFVDHQKSSRRYIDEEEVLEVTENIDRLYIDAPLEFTLPNMMHGGTLKISRKNTCDVNIWNPWDQKGIRYLGDDEFQYFIAIEAGRAINRIKLDPLSAWQARHIFEIIPDKKKSVAIVTDFYDLFDDCKTETNKN